MPPRRSVSRDHTGRTTPWRRDNVILDRLAQHVELVRGVPYAQQRAIVRAAQHISDDTFDQDRRRLRELQREAIGRSWDEIAAEIDAGYRAAIEDADRFTCEAPAQGPARALHQANKIRALDSRAQLYGLKEAFRQRALDRGEITPAVAALPPPVEFTLVIDSPREMGEALPDGRVIDLPR